MKILFDRVNLEGSKRKITPEGFMTVPATIARSGHYNYKAGELGFEDRDPEEQITVYRPPEEVFNDDSMQSFANKPVTNNHPQELVTIDNIKQYQVGFSGSQAMRNGDLMETILTITDKETIENIQSGKCEISNGYTADLEMESGFADGLKYDAIQRNIKGNHVAIVDRGRAGKRCKIADKQTITKDGKMKIMLDGIEYEVDNQIAQVVEKLQNKETQLSGKIETMTADHATELESVKSEAQKEKDILQAKLDDAESRVVADADIEAKVEERVKLISDAKSLVKDLDTVKKSNAEIIAAVVADKCESVNIDDVSPDYIKARFDMLLEQKSTESDGHERVVVDAQQFDDEDPYEKHKAESENRWQKKDK